jgi:transcriptional regulator with XRE-family HTH domain
MNRPKGRPIDAEEQALRDLLAANIKKFRRRRKWSQFVLAERIDISTNFLADMEAGNTWVSSQTLVKLAKAFEVEVYELLKPQKERDLWDEPEETDPVKILMDRFSRDLTVVLKDSVEKAVEHVRKEFTE